MLIQERTKKIVFGFQAFCRALLEIGVGIHETNRYVTIDVFYGIRSHVAKGNPDLREVQTVQFHTAPKGTFSSCSFVDPQSKISVLSKVSCESAFYGDMVCLQLLRGF